MQPPGKLRERNEVSPNVGFLELVGVAHIEEKEAFAMVEAAFQVFGLNFRDTHFGFSPFCPKTQNPPASTSSGGGSQERFELLSLLALQSPHAHARRHVSATHTRKTTDRGLLGAKTHALRITRFSQSGSLK